jgi:amidophosphoribosyltransferase
MCGIVLAHTLHDVRSMLGDLQHRGKEAAGIAAIGDGRIDVLKWVGKVGDINRDNLHRIFPANDYHTFMAHVRYATKGQKDPDEILNDAHPHTIGGTVEKRGKHVLIFDCDMAMIHNGQVNVDSLEEVVENELQTGCDTEALLHYYKEVGARQILRKLKGAYTLAIADKKRNEVVVMRDPLGIRIGVIGVKGGIHCVASEDVAIRKNGGKKVMDLRPGAAYFFDPHGGFTEEQVVEDILKLCFFDRNYLSSPESIIDGVSVQTIRTYLGEEVAEEVDARKFDLVTYVPESPEAAAKSCAKKLGLPLIDVFYKLGDRSFMNSTQEQRERSIKTNLYLKPRVEEKIRGKRVLVIEDSFVRGTVGKRIKHLLYNVAEVRKAVAISYTPPIGVIGDDGIPRGCVSGVDMSPEENENHSFIARIDGRNATPKEIKKAIGMPIKYLSVEGMNRAFEIAGIPPKNLCTYCIGGEKPFDDLIQLRRK